jgi:hypothetical protein
MLFAKQHLSAKRVRFLEEPSSAPPTTAPGSPPTVANAFRLSPPIRAKDSTRPAPLRPSRRNGPTYRRPREFPLKPRSVWTRQQHARRGVHPAPQTASPSRPRSLHNSHFRCSPDSDQALIANEEFKDTLANFEAKVKAAKVRCLHDSCDPKMNCEMSFSCSHLFVLPHGRSPKPRRRRQRQRPWLLGPRRLPRVG